MARARSIRVLVADDNAAVRRAMRVRLEQADGITLIGSASNGIDAVALARAERADVVLMDLQMPGMNGLDATRELTRKPSERNVAVIVMTSHAGDRFVLQSLYAGAVGYLLKSHDTDQLLDAIHAAARGDALVSTRVTAPLLRELTQHRAAWGDDPAVSVLTRAEQKVVGALSRGFTSNEEIAAHLHLSVNTVRSQLRTAMNKIGVDNRTRLALWGARNHLDVDDS